MMLLESFLAALCAAFVVMTMVQTGWAYGSLPARIPTGYNADGTARGMGPRVAIWLVPLIQLFAASVMGYADWAIATHQPGAHGSLFGSLIASVPALGMLWRMQIMMISAARSPLQRLQMRPFLTSVLGGVALVLLVAFTIH